MRPLVVVLRALVVLAFVLLATMAGATLGTMLMGCGGRTPVPVVGDQ